MPSLPAIPPDAVSGKESSRLPPLLAWSVPARLLAVLLLLLPLWLATGWALDWWR